MVMLLVMMKNKNKKMMKSLSKLITYSNEFYSKNMLLFLDSNHLALEGNNMINEELSTLIQKIKKEVDEIINL